MKYQIPVSLQSGKVFLSREYFHLIKLATLSSVVNSKVTFRSYQAVQILNTIKMCKYNFFFSVQIRDIEKSDNSDNLVMDRS
jgi:hypothetical protein